MKQARTRLISLLLEDRVQSWARTLYNAYKLQTHETIMPYRLRTQLNAALIFGLVLTSPLVLSVDLDELYDNPDVGDTLDAGDELYDNPDVGDTLDAGDGLMESVESTEYDILDAAGSVDDELMESDGLVEDELMEYADPLEDESSAISDLLFEGSSSALPKDVVMVLDNSGSMKKNDPDFLATRAVSEFISGLDAQTRIAIIIFDQSVSLAVPLTHLSFETRDKIVSSLEKINYKGLFTDSPAAIERAIYELKNNGRAEAQKSIVFMTDGIVDTGKADVDLEKSKWLKEDLAADAADESIKVFGVAFTEAADFQLIQSIAQKTDGEYYRALQASDLQKVFKQINDIINRSPEVDVMTTPVTVPAPAEPSTPVVQQPVIIEVPAQTSQSMSKEERVRSTIMIVAAAVLFITLLAIVYLLLKRSREMSSAANEVVSEAFVNDINNYTGTSQYQLGQKPTMFGRVAGKDTEHLNYLVIPESTIGRRHALIEYKDYGFWVSDQGSINGTFVNDQLINSEVCLKHGDKIRLHKFEFEFVMPEMDDAGVTVMSSTQFAGQANNADAATVLKDSASSIPEVPDMEPEFDITGSVEPEPEPEFDLEMGDDEDEDDEETLIRGDSSVEELANETDPGEEDEDETIARADSDTAAAEAGNALAEDEDSEDETLIPSGKGLQEDQADGDAVEEKESLEDETLMRENFDAIEDEDMTIRKQADEAVDDFFDIGADADNGDGKNN